MTTLLKLTGVFVVLATSGMQVNAQQTFIGHAGGPPPLPHESAVLELNADDKGLLLPRLSSHNDVTNPADGLIIYDISDQCINVFDGSSWRNLCESDGTGGESTFGWSCPGSNSPMGITQVTSINYTQFLVTEDGKMGLEGDLGNGSIWRMFPDLANSSAEANYDVVNFFDADELGAPWRNGGLKEFEIGAQSGFKHFTALAIAENDAGEDTVYVGRVSTRAGLYGFFEVTGIEGTPIDVAVSGGEYLILTDTGNLYVGSHAYNATNTTPTLTVPPNGLSVTSISAGSEGTEALSGNKYIETSDGTVYAWGNQDSREGGWTGSPSIRRVDQMVEIDVPPIKRVSRGESMTLWITDDGELYGNGGSFPQVPTKLVPPDGLLDAGETWAYAEAMGGLHAVAVTSTGKVYSLYRTMTNNWFEYWHLEPYYAIDPNDVELSYRGEYFNTQSVERIYARNGNTYVTWETRDPYGNNSPDNTPVIQPLCD